MLRYTTDIDDLTPEHLAGPFFIGWPDAPDTETHLRILRGAASVVVARDGEAVVGFVTALTDGVLMAFIPLLEVTPAYEGQGIGGELVRRMVQELEPMYAIDAVCDPEVVPFYEKRGFVGISAVARRDYSVQSGRR